MAFYRVCQSCGANLDPGEKCDCKRIKMREQESREKRAEEIRRLCTIEKNGQFRLAV